MGVMSNLSARLSRWRTAVIINTCVTGIATLILGSVLISEIASTGDINRSHIFYSGSCEGDTVNVNIAIHLALNILSSAILASSNFFMQITNAPSREEIEAAHANGTWLDIGIPSWRNVFRVSRFKTVSWFFFLVSSIPIHLFFNSTVFRTDRRESYFQVALAAEGFLDRDPWAGPGASLVPGAVSLPTTFSNITEEHFDPVPVFDYDVPDSAVVRNITSMVDLARTWDKLTPRDCRREYLNCSGLRNHRNLVIVLDSPSPQGWSRDSIQYPSGNGTGYAQKNMMGNGTNSLWYATQCSMVAATQMSDNERTGSISCSNACKHLLANLGDDKGNPNPDDPNWIIDFRNRWLLEAGSWANRDNPEKMQGFFDVQYCLAEPHESLCGVGVSQILLMIVTVCTLVKFILCIVVMMHLNHNQSLVTVGDAVASFIARPSPATRGLCLVDMEEARFASKDFRSVPGPRKFKKQVFRVGFGVPKTVWIASYSLFIVGLGSLWYGAATTISVAGGKLKGSLGEPSAVNGSSLAETSVAGTFLAGVLAINSPQILLSICYLAYNSLFTRLEMVKEWAKMSLGYTPLRVTEPLGGQYSTYFLQIRFKYSIPLLTLSIFLHWMLSNTLYIIVVEGGYFATEQYVAIHDDPSLPPQTALSFGYSSVAMITLVIVFIIMCIIPIVVASPRLAGDIPIAGSNSLAIMAACHVSPLAKVDDTSSDVPKKHRSLDSGAVELRRLTYESSNAASSAETLEACERKTETADEYHRKKLSQGALKWGEVEMPPSWYEAYPGFEQQVGHLSFGTSVDSVQPPTQDRWYE